MTGQPPEEQPQLFYTAEEVARLIRVSEQTIRAWIRDGKLPARRFGRNWRIPSADVQRILAEGLPDED
jgi:excisionase family DNA binding protein